MAHLILFSKTAYDVDEKTRMKQAESFLSFLYANTPKNEYVTLANKGYNGKGWYQNFAMVKDAPNCVISDNLDRYASVNTFASNKSRYESNCASINGIFLDLDLHPDKKGEFVEPEVVNNEVQKAVNVLNLLVNSNKIPSFSMACFSGRGLALFYLYKDPSSVDVSVHRRLYTSIMDTIKQYMANYGIQIKMDTSVRDMSRVCRIPGTYNNKAGRYAKLLNIHNIRYSTDELLKYFPIKNVEDVVEEKQTAEKKESKSKSKKKEKTGQKTKKDKKPVLLKECGYDVKVPAWVANLSKRRMEQIEEVMQMRGGCDGSGRENAVFIYYNLARSVYKEKDAFKRTESLNLSFDEPLSEREFLSCINGVNFHKESGDWAGKLRCHSDSVYIFSTEIFAEKMSFTDEEKESIGLYVRAKQKADAVKRKKIKTSKKERLVLMLKNGVNKTAIAKELGVSRATLYKWIDEVKDYPTEKEEYTENNVNMPKVYSFGVNKKREEEKKEGNIKKNICVAVKKGDFSLNKGIMLSKYSSMLKLKGYLGIKGDIGIKFDCSNKSSVIRKIFDMKNTDGICNTNCSVKNKLHYGLLHCGYG